MLLATGRIRADSSDSFARCPFHNNPAQDRSRTDRSVSPGHARSVPGGLYFLDLALVRASIAMSKKCPHFPSLFRFRSSQQLAFISCFLHHRSPGDKTSARPRSCRIGLFNGTPPTPVPICSGSMLTRGRHGRSRFAQFHPPLRCQSTQFSAPHWMPKLRVSICSTFPRRRSSNELVIGQSG